MDQQVESGFTLYDYYKIVKKRKLVFFVPFGVIVFLGMWLTIGQPKVYETSAALIFDQPVSSTSSNQEGLQTMIPKFQEIARSPDLITKLVKTLNSSIDPSVISSNISLRLDPSNAAIMRVTLQGGDPALITKILSGFLPLFVEAAEKTSQDRLDGIISYIKDQMRVVQGQLQEVEGKIKEMQEVQRLISVPEEMSGALSAEKNYQAELTKMEFDDRNLQNSIDNLKRRLSGGKSGGEKNATFSTNREVIVMLRQQLTSLEMESMNLSMVYAANHPKLREVSEKIDFIKKKLSNETVRAYADSNVSTENNEVIRVSVEELVKLENQFATQEARKVFVKEQIQQCEKSFLELSNKKQNYTALMRQQRSLEQSLSSLIDRHNSALIDRQAAGNKISPLSQPYLPAFPSKPNVRVYLLFTLVLAFVTGLAMVSLAEQIDTSVKTPQEVQMMLNLPVRGMIQDLSKCNNYVPQNRDPLDAMLCTHLYPGSKESESFRILRTNILHLYREQPFQTFMIASATECVGKSTMTANVGVVIAQAGYRVILVDTDLRHPTLHKKFRLDNARGLTNLLTGMPFSEAIQPTCIPRLSILTSGPLPPNPSELIQNDGFTDVINFLKSQADFIIFDNPPLNLVTDSLILATKLQRTFYLVGMGYTDRKEVQVSYDLLKGLNCDIAGVICNRIAASEMGGYYYYYTKTS
ncbi:MAG: polysaccharide biosynthesis tyrosine autokinase [Candidatus Riflebacteria bacterium]|nr:polysaccharide biosynthesis tyrosine autokinase [Candidatus Riflebacteria bacterium]